MQPRIRQRKHKLAPGLGGAFILLALIGIITVVVISLRLTMRVLDNTQEREEFENLIRPIVMFNPSPFEAPQDIEMTQLLQYSMWSALTSERGKNYTRAETSELVVPASDLDVAAHNLFGEDIQLEHQSFGDIETRYVYDSEKNIYNVPQTATLYVYSPKVEEVVKEGELYRLTVGYIPPDNAWLTHFAGSKENPEADKRMYFYLDNAKDGYHVVKLQDIPLDTQSNAVVVPPEGENQQQ